MAGKTGNTDGYFDAWFMGYSPQIITGGISFANINTKNGKLAGPSSTHSLRQAFRAGEVPTERSSEADSLEDQSFFKDDLSG